MIDFKDLNNWNVTDVNKHYFNRYLNFIDNIKSKGDRCLDYSEKHHIIPRSINESLEKCQDNIIILSAREHFIAHYMLLKLFLNNTIEKTKMSNALFYIISISKQKIGKDIKINSRLYEQIRKEFSSAHSGKLNGRYGTKSKCMYKDGITKMIPIEEIKEYKANGWVLGIAYETKSRNRTWVNNGTTSRMILNSELDEFLSKNKDYTIGRESFNLKNSKIKLNKYLNNELSDNESIMIHDEMYNYNVRLFNVVEMLDNKFVLGRDYNLPVYNSKMWVNNGDVQLYINDIEFKFMNKQNWTKGVIKTIHNKNKVWVNNGYEELLIDKSLLSQYDSWNRGRIKNKDYCIVNNGDVNKKIKISELNDYISLGWQKGIYRPRWQGSTKNTIGVNNGNINKFIPIEELESYLTNGWVKGINWSLNKHKGDN